VNDRALVQKLFGHRTAGCPPLVESPMLRSVDILDADQYSRSTQYRPSRPL